MLASCYLGLVIGDGTDLLLDLVAADDVDEIRSDTEARRGPPRRLQYIACMHIHNVN
jgi:hypothetical protein